MRFLDADVLVPARDRDTKTRLEEHKKRARRPGLGHAGDRISDRAITATAPLESAIELRKTHFQAHRRFEHLVEDTHDACAFAIARHPGRAQRSVVGPYRAVVIRHWIVARLALRDGAYAPSRVERCGEQMVDYASRPLGRGQSDKE